jgi:hypothetical protein
MALYAFGYKQWKYVKYLCLIKHHAIEDILGNGCIAPRINLGTKQR